MSITLSLPIMLTARFDFGGWEHDGASIVIAFGDELVHEVPYPEYEKTQHWPDDDEVAKIAAQWLAGRLGPR